MRRMRQSSRCKSRSQVCVGTLYRLPSPVLCLVLHFYCTWVNYDDRSRKDCWQIVGLISKKMYEFRAKHNVAHYGWTAACAHATDETILDISHMMGIRSLDLEEAVNVTDAGLSVLTRLTSLRKLSLSSGNFTVVALENIKPIAHRLQYLDLSNFVLTSYASLCLAQNFTSVHSLFINGRCRDVEVVLESLSQLRFLEVNYYQTGANTIQYLGLAFLPLLTSLDVSNVTFTKTNGDEFSSLTSLTWLRIEMCHLNAKVLKMFSSLPLQSLYIEGDSSALELIGDSFKLLTFLKFGCRIDEQYDIEHLANLNFLQSLWLDKCHSLHLFGNSFSTLTALKQLQLTECFLPTEAMQNISTGKFEILIIESPLEMFDCGFQFLSKLTTLQGLGIYTCSRITDRIYYTISHCPRLIEVNTETCTLLTSGCQQMIQSVYKIRMSDLIQDPSRMKSCSCVSCTS